MALSCGVNFQNLQLQITVNTPSSKVRFVGNPLSPIYPEILIWRPDYAGSDKGKAVLVEIVETSRTLNSNPINKWTFLSSLRATGVIFNLVIPIGEATRVRTMLTQNNIAVTNLIGYTLNNNGVYSFSII